MSPLNRRALLACAAPLLACAGLACGFGHGAADAGEADASASPDGGPDGGSAGSPWTNRTPRPLPSAWPEIRHMPFLAYDQGRRRVVLFGGHDRDLLDDTWEWEPTSGLWTQRPITGPAPRRREEGGFVYDPDRRRVILYGGVCNPLCDDLWEWDGEAGTWTELMPTGASPSARATFGMVWDADRHLAVLFGGWNNLGILAEIWEWNPSAAAWTLAPAAKPGPQGGPAPAVSYDSRRKRLVVFHRQQTWEWDAAAASWTAMPTPGAVPAAVANAAFAYDARRGVSVLYGGEGQGCPQMKYCGDVWEWDGVSWSNRTPATGLAPAAHGLSAAVYDATRARTVIFGGLTGTGPGTYDNDNELWEWAPP